MISLLLKICILKFYTIFAVHSSKKGKKIPDHDNGQAASMAIYDVPPQAECSLTTPEWSGVNRFDKRRLCRLSGVYTPF